MVPWGHPFCVDFPDHLQAVFEQGSRLRQQGYRGRFAPTPSGPLHLGNLRTALLSWLQARLQGGQWLLRIDDLDTPRIRSGAIESVLDDLQWLELRWDGPVIYQSRRRGIYSNCLSVLRRAQCLYPCRCSRRQLGAGRRYPGTCRELIPDWSLRDGRPPAWRLRVNAADEARCGDLVLRRADGFIAYHLATSVDELSLGITEVVRGEDLASASIAQKAVILVLSQEPPRYLHTPLLCDSDGRKLSKRAQASGLTQLREQQWTSSQVLGWLAASLNLVPSGQALSLSELLHEVRAHPLILQSRLDEADS